MGVPGLADARWYHGTDDLTATGTTGSWMIEKRARLQTFGVRITTATAGGAGGVMEVSVYRAASKAANAVKQTSPKPLRFNVPRDAHVGTIIYGRPLETKPIELYAGDEVRMTVQTALSASSPAGVVQAFIEIDEWGGFDINASLVSEATVTEA